MKGLHGIGSVGILICWTGETYGTELCPETRGTELCPETRGNELCLETRGTELCPETRGTELCPVTGFVTSRVTPVGSLPEVCLLSYLVKLSM